MSLWRLLAGTGHRTGAADQQSLVIEALQVGRDGLLLSSVIHVLAVMLLLILSYRGRDPIPPAKPEPSQQQPQAAESEARLVLAPAFATAAEQHAAQAPPLPDLGDPPPLDPADLIAPGDHRFGGAGSGRDTETAAPGDSLRLAQIASPTTTPARDALRNSRPDQASRNREQARRRTAWAHLAEIFARQHRQHWASRFPGGLAAQLDLYLRVGTDAETVIDARLLSSSGDPAYDQAVLAWLTGSASSDDPIRLIPTEAGAWLPLMAIPIPGPGR